MEQTFKLIEKKIEHRRICITISAIATGIAVTAMIICIIACCFTIVISPVSYWIYMLSDYTDDSALYGVRDTLRLIDKIAACIAITGGTSFTTLIASVHSHHKLKAKRNNLAYKAYADAQVQVKETALSCISGTNTVVPRR